ncbi:MAG: rod-binding protein [Candidatus Hatepunaea meridiana]|nr:rod-binding protein [Candidatus Hatepunaea meridiana]
MKINPNETVLQSNVKHLDSTNNRNKLPVTDQEKENRLRQTSKDLEAVFITQMFKVMEKTIPKSSLTGSKNTLSSMMFSSVMGEALANQGGIGLSDIIYRSLNEKDEMPSPEQINPNPFIQNIHSFGLFDTEDSK